MGVLVLVFVAFRIYTNKRRRKLKKFLYQQPNTANNHPGISSQVTLMPIQNVQVSQRQSRTNSDYQRHRSRLVPFRNQNSEEISRDDRAQQGPHYPPSYNESFLDNGGSIVAVWNQKTTYLVIYYRDEKKQFICHLSKKWRNLRNELHFWISKIVLYVIEKKKRFKSENDYNNQRRGYGLTLSYYV